MSFALTLWALTSKQHANAGGKGTEVTDVRVILSTTVASWYSDSDVRRQLQPSRSDRLQDHNHAIKIGAFTRVRRGWTTVFEHFEYLHNFGIARPQIKNDDKKSQCGGTFTGLSGCDHQEF